jgi:hypothetical protein
MEEAVKFLDNPANKDEVLKVMAKYLVHDLPATARSSCYPHPARAPRP